MYCQNQTQVHGYGVYYGEICTLSLLFLFCIKYIQGWNTNHKLNDLTSKATTLKGLHLLSIPHSAAQCEKQLHQIKVSVFLPVSTFRRLPCFFSELCSDFSRATAGLQESRTGPLCLKWPFTKSLQNVFKTTKAFDVISLNVYFFKNSNL